MLLLLFQHTRFFLLFFGVAINGAEPTAHHPSVAGKALLLLQVFSCFSAKKMDETVIVSIKNYITRSFFLWPQEKEIFAHCFGYWLAPLLLLLLSSRTGSRVFTCCCQRNRSPLITCRLLLVPGVLLHTIARAQTNRPKRCFTQWPSSGKCLN